MSYSSKDEETIGENSEIFWIRHFNKTDLTWIIDE